eukprot:gene5080-6979_t
MVVTSGSGFVRGNRLVYDAIEERILNEGVGVDWICLTAPLCHNTPLISFDLRESMQCSVNGMHQNDDEITGSAQAVCLSTYEPDSRADKQTSYRCPEWIHQCLYNFEEKILLEAGWGIVDMDIAILPRFMAIKNMLPNTNPLPLKQDSQNNFFNDFDFHHPSFRSGQVCGIDNQCQVFKHIVSLPPKEDFERFDDECWLRSDRKPWQWQFSNDKLLSRIPTKQKQSEDLKSKSVDTLISSHRTQIDPNPMSSESLKSVISSDPTKAERSNMNNLHRKTRLFTKPLNVGEGHFRFLRRSDEKLPVIKRRLDRRYSCPSRFGVMNRRLAEDRYHPDLKDIVAKRKQYLSYLKELEDRPRQRFASLPTFLDPSTQESYYCREKLTPFLPQRASWVTKRLQAIPPPCQLPKPEKFEPFLEQRQEQLSTIVFRRWQHAFAPIYKSSATPYGPLWKSLETPACLPLSTGYRPDGKELESVSTPEDNSIKFAKYLHCFQSSSSKTTSRDSQSFVVGLLLMFGAQYSEKEIGEIRALELLNVYNDVTPRTVDKESSMDTPALCSNNDLSLSSEFVKTAQQRSGTSDSPKRTNQSKSFFANLFGSKKVSSSQSPITKTGMTAEKPINPIWMILHSGLFQIYQQGHGASLIPYLDKTHSHSERSYNFALIPYRRRQMYTLSTRFRQHDQSKSKEYQVQKWFMLLTMLQTPLNIYELPSQHIVDCCQFWRVRYVITPSDKKTLTETECIANMQEIQGDLNQFLEQKYREKVPLADSRPEKMSKGQGTIQITDLLDIQYIPAEKQASPYSNEHILSNAIWLNMTNQETHRNEWAILYYDREYYADQCFHFEIQWIIATGANIKSLVRTFETKINRRDMKLTKIPIRQLKETCNRNPFRIPRKIRLAWSPDESKILSRGNFSSHTFMHSVLHHLGFFLDMVKEESKVQKLSNSTFSRIHLLLKADLLIVWALQNTEPGVHPSPRMYPMFENTQYVHRSGCSIIQIREYGTTMLYHANLLVNDGAHPSSGIRGAQLLSADDADILESVLNFCE